MNLEMSWPARAQIGKLGRDARQPWVPDLILSVTWLDPME